MNKTLDTKIWNSDKTLKKDVRLTLLNLAKDFYKYLDVKNLILKDIVFVGSLANYNYTDTSDIDLHLIVDYSKLEEDEIIKDLIQSKKAVWNSEHDIKVKGYDVEVYPEDIENKQPSTGKFSLIKNKWIIEPDIKNIKQYDVNVIKKKAKSYKEKIDYFEKQAKKKNINKEKLLKKIDDFRQKISETRKVAIKTKGEFSTENLIFKYLRNTKYLEKLKTLRNDLFDSQYTIKEFFI